MTNNLSRRVYEHRKGAGSIFCRKYGVHRLVRAEPFEDIVTAIAREKRLKKRPRAWKINLIESDNPGWEDLYDRINEYGMWSPT